MRNRSRISSGFECLVRRKQVDSANARLDGRQLAQRLSVFDLIAIGVGSTVGAGVYILVGTVAKEQAGPAITISFLIAGIAAGLSAFCYAELACRCPSAGSAYHYSYVCVGEGVAWLIGWSLILEYTLGGAAVARGISPNMTLFVVSFARMLVIQSVADLTLIQFFVFISIYSYRTIVDLALFFGGEDKLPSFLARLTIHGIVVDPCAAVLVCIVAGLLCTGIKESSLAQAIITTINVTALVFIILAGGYLGFKTGWVGYEVPTGYFPYGVNGILSGSATVFFSYVGFDAVTSTAEEVKNPQRDMPLGIGISLCTCCILYMLVSFVVIGLVPCYSLDSDTPISSAFASYGMDWAVYIITTGAITALCAALIGGILPQPRILMAMARDGLLPAFFSDINKRTQVPVKSTILTGIFIATLAFFMDVSQLAGMVSVGTLLAFTGVAISVLILRYVPPHEVLLPSSLPESVSSQFNSDNWKISNKSPNYRLGHRLIQKDIENEVRRRKIAAWSIFLVCTGVLVLTSAASVADVSLIPRIILCGFGGIVLLSGLIILACIDQDEARLDFGHTGGFLCPFVPFLPVTCILVNVYLLINLGGGTWMRVSVWLVLGALVYIFYGRTHSSLSNSSFVPLKDEDDLTDSYEICSSPSTRT